MKKNILFLLIAPIITILDLTVKNWVLTYTKDQPYPISNSIEVSGDFFRITYVRNYGITFGLLNNLPMAYTKVILSITSLAALWILFYFYRNLHTLVQEKAYNASKVALMMIFGGAMGNIIDRILHGFVVDFLDFGINSYRWYTFNIADTFIVSGCILLGLMMTIFPEPSQKNQ